MSFKAGFNTFIFLMLSLFIIFQNDAMHTPSVEKAQEEFSHTDAVNELTRNSYALLDFFGRIYSIKHDQEILKKTESYIKAGVWLDLRGTGGLVCLHHAADYYKVQLTKLLLENGACVHILDEWGWSPIHYAIYNPLDNNEKSITRCSIIQLLIAHGANINAPTRSQKMDKDNGGFTPLHFAVVERDISLVHFLLKHGAYINSQDVGGDTPLHVAMKMNNVELGKALIEAGASVTKRNKKGNIPAYEALLHGADVECLLLSLSRGRLPQSKKLACSGILEEIWDLESLALMNLANNIACFDEQSHSSQETILRMRPSLLHCFEKVIPFLDLKNKKIRQFFSYVAAQKLLNFCEKQHLKKLRKLLLRQDENSLGIVDCAQKMERADWINVLHSVFEAESFEMLPEEIQEKTVFNINRNAPVIKLVEDRLNLKIARSLSI